MRHRHRLLQPRRRGDWIARVALVRRDADGYFWFVGRGDDVIKSAGHLVGPFEVESALLEHPALADACGIGTPDPIAGEVVKASVALEPDHQARRSPAPRADRVRPPTGGRPVAAREVEFVDSVPLTRSGKIMRPNAQGPQAGTTRGGQSRHSSRRDHDTDREHRMLGSPGVRNGALSCTGCSASGRLTFCGARR